MKAISLENLFGIIPSWSYNGCEEIDINED